LSGLPVFWAASLFRIRHSRLYRARAKRLKNSTDLFQHGVTMSPKINKKIASIIIVLLAIACVGGYFLWTKLGPSQPSVEQTLIIGTTTSVDILDPATGGSWPTYMVSNLCFDTLLGLKTPECVEVVPELATEWTVSNDSKTFSFIIRQDVKFHDGTPLTAESVKKSLEYVITKAGPNSFFLDDISSIEVTSTYQMRINLKNSDIGFLSKLAMNGLVFPILNADAANAAGDQWGKSVLIGSGPFKFNESREGERIVVVRNDEYWGQKAKLDKIIISLFANSATARMALESGEIDMFYRNPNPDDAIALKANPIIETQSLPGSSRHLYFHLDVPPMDNVLLRKAIAYAINVTRVWQVGYKGEGTISYSMVPDYMVPYYKPTFAKYAYDPGKATELLNEAGYPTGFSTKLYYTTNWSPMDIDAALVIKDDLAKVGINVEIVMEEYAVFSADLYNGVMPMDIDNWAPDYPSVDNVIMQAIHPDYGWDATAVNWYNARFVELGYLGKNTTDENARKLIYDEAQDIMAEEVPVYPLVFRPGYVFYRSWVKGFVFYPMAHSDKISFVNTYIGPKE